jgi:nucleotide-binding universal stress UspA family protein
MKRIRRVLYASDFSKASSRAFQTAMTMAKASKARLTIVHVIVPFMAMVPEHYADSGTLDQLAAQARQWSQRQLAKLAARAKGTGSRTTALLREGDPAEQIVRAARSERADLIVVGTHGRRGFSKLFVGSVAERVVRTAPCPVVTVQGK